VTHREVTHIELKDLLTNSAWHFRITATNAVGTSEPFLPEDPVTAGKRISKFIFSNLWYLLVSEPKYSSELELVVAFCSKRWWEGLYYPDINFFFNFNLGIVE